MINQDSTIPLNVSIQGVKASFHDVAASRFLGSTNPLFCKNFPDTVSALISGEVEYAVCAIENSLYGSINEVYDLISNNNVHIIGELYLRIEQCLISLPGADLKNITSVYSHPVALAQCTEFLDAKLTAAEREEYYDTAAAVELIKDRNDKRFAAIASSEAAALHDMHVLARSIETNKENFTRFVLLSRDNSTYNATTKTSLKFRTDHTPGSLYRALGCFASRKINLSKIQSRPIIGEPWKYWLYIDAESGVGSERMQDAIAELHQQGAIVEILGSYTTY